MDPFTIIAVIALAASAVKQYQGAQYADELGKANAANIEAEANEEARRLADAQSRNRGRTRAGMAASGATLGDTNALYLQEMTNMQESEMDWLFRAADSRANIATMQGHLAKQQGEAAALGTIASAASLGAGPTATTTSSYGGAGGLPGQQAGGWGGLGR